MNGKKTSLESEVERWRRTYTRAGRQDGWLIATASCACCSTVVRLVMPSVTKSRQEKSILEITIETSRAKTRKRLEKSFSSYRAVVILV